VMDLALSRHANELPERLEAAIGDGWVDRDEDPPDYDALLADAAATIRQLAQRPRHDPTAGTQFLMCALAPEGVKAHPLDTIPVALPPHVDVYGLLADATRFAGEGGSMWVPEGDDAKALDKMAHEFGKWREHPRRST
jgi:hypothetical protein